MTIFQLVTFTAFLFKDNHLIPFQMINYLCMNFIRVGAYGNFIIVAYHQHFRKLNLVPGITTQAMNEEFIILFYLELLPRDINYCKHDVPKIISAKVIHFFILTNKFSSFLIFFILSVLLIHYVFHIIFLPRGCKIPDEHNCVCSR
jgi:hypothetical protein